MWIVSWSAPITMCLGLIGILVNVVLLAVVRRSSRRQLSRINAFVVLKCVVDLVFASTAVLTAVSFTIDSGLMFYTTHGLARFLPAPIDYASIDVGITLACCLPLTPVAAIVYRYCLVCRRVNLTPRQICGIFFGVLSLGLIVLRVKMMAFHVSIPLSDVQKRVLERRLAELEEENPGFDDQRIYISSTAIHYHRIGMAGVALIALVCGVVITYCSVKTFSKLNSLTGIMSRNTMNMHRLNVKVLLAQAIIPVVFTGSPLIALETCYYLKKSWPFWLTTIIVWDMYAMAIVNPLTALTSTPSFRRTFAQTVRSLSISRALSRSQRIQQPNKKY